MKILLLDTAFAAGPIYDYLVRENHDVWVMGNRKNDVLAKKSGDKWVELDYSKIDEVASCVERLGIDYLVPGCTDVSIETCVSIRGGDILDTHQANNIISNKSSFRELCQRLNLPSPEVVGIDAFPRQGLYICKPVDSFSGRGVAIFDGALEGELVSAVQVAKKESVTNRIILESYVEGQLYSYSAFLENHCVVSSFIVKEGASANPFAVDTSYVTDALSGKPEEILKSSVERISNYLQLVDGLIHTQFIFDGDVPILIEMSRRCPGDLYSLLIEYSTGYEYGAKYASYFINDSYSAEQTSCQHVLRHTVSSNESIVFGKLEFVSHQPQPVKAFYPLQVVGSSLLPMQKTRAGILFTQYSSSIELLENYNGFINRSLYNIE